MERISVITICFNCKEALERTIRSVASQTYPLEYIIVDGGSNDGTLEVINANKEYISKYVSEPDEGIYDALNKGVDMATGEWLICMNAGDTFHNEKVLEQVMSVPRNEIVKFLYSDYYMINPKGEEQLYHVDRNLGNVFHQACIYKKELHARYGYYVVTKPYIASDLLFFLSVPETFYMKVDYPICVSEYAGISSQGTWCAESALGLRVAFRKESLSRAFFKICKTKFRKWLCR